MTDAHRAATAASSRPPWETPLVGVRCPTCGLGGDIPETIVLTICPRCEAVFDVASARAVRPADVPPPIPVPVPSVALEPLALEPIALGPIPPPPIWDAEIIVPPAPNDPLTLAGMALIPPPRAPRPRVSARRPATASATARSTAARPRRRVRVAAVGVSMFALGMTVGWTVFRSGDDTPTEVRDAGVEREVADAERSEIEGRSSNGPADSGDGEVVGPAAGTGSASGSPTDRGSATIKRSTGKKASSSKKSSSSDSGKKSTEKKSSTKKSSDDKKTADDKKDPDDKSSGRSSGASSTTALRDGTTTTRAASTDRDGGALSSTTLADTTVTTVGSAPPAQPGVSLPVVRACSGLDCRMTAPSGFDGIPIPDDTVEVSTAKGVTGWTTHVATIEELTAWYLDHLTVGGWVLNGPASVMDPAEGEAHELGHSTSAIYCPSDSDDPIVAVNVGWPADDTSGGTVVIGLVGGIDESACA